MKGVELIAAERKRQVEEEGWTPEHDDTHTNGELARAAAFYAVLDMPFLKPLWPWDESWRKPSTPIRNLTRAGALIAAEIDRLQRAKT